MNYREVCENIVTAGGCLEAHIECSSCPFTGKHDGTGSIKMAKAWLESHGGTMNKNKALIRLDSIEKEQAELRKIIEKGDKIVYDEQKIYVALYENTPYIMTGRGYGTGDNFVFNSFSNYRPAIQSYSPGKDTAQECLDYHADAGFTIHVFYDTKEALQFFIDHL